MAATHVPLAEYLATTYEPDVDYVDGVLEDRHVGEKDHGKLLYRMAKLAEAAGFFIAIETRLRVGPSRYRVPDVMVYAVEPAEQVFETPPLLVIEIVSPEDRLGRIHDKVEDYTRMGAPCVWVLDPQRKVAFQHTPEAALHIVAALTHPTEPRLQFVREQVFA